MSANLADAIAYLQQTNTEGRSLYDHLADVLLRLLEQRPTQALDAFDSLSHELKKSPAAPLLPQQASLASPVPPSFLSELARGLFRPTSSEDDRPVGNEGEMADLMEQLEQLEWAGACVGTKEEAYRLALSMRRLLEANPLNSVRLWGKILGTKADYYVCETLYKDGVERDTPAPVPEKQKSPEDEDSESEDEGKEEEERKKKEEEAKQLETEVAIEKDIGTNKYTYWVCHNPGEEWVKLPSVTPAQIAASRRARRLLTGDLEAPVQMWPAFPGNEANLLRAIVARITAATLVSPRGFYTTDEAEEETEEEADLLNVVEQEEYTGLASDALLDARNWVHHHASILLQGRCQYWRAPKPVSDDDEESEEEQEEQLPADVLNRPKILTSVADDEALPGGLEAWTIRKGSSVLSRYAPVCAISHRWPGAVAVAYNGGMKFANIYVGYGTKYATEPYTPLLPKLPAAEHQPAAALDEAKDPTLEEEQEFQRKIEEEERLKKEAEEAAARAAEEAAAAAAQQDSGGGTATDTDAAQTGEDETTEDEDLEEDD